MYIADAHCDALWKMTQQSVPFTSSRVTVNKNSLKNGNVKTQVFALYVPPHWPIKKQRHELKRQMELFHSQIKPALPASTEAILALEGASLPGEDQSLQQKLLESGVSMASLTWNEENALAYGSSQPSHLGIKAAGKRFIAWQNSNNIIVDGAHLNEKGFWEALEHADRFLVSHTNIKSIYNHPRNLTDAQIQAVKEKDGFIGLTFYPLFINGSSEAALLEFTRQIDHACSIGAERIIGIGSDFDGIDHTVTSIQGPEDYPILVDHLLRHFSKDIVKGIAYGNFRRFLDKKNLNKFEAN
ncbi:dipeptidase [Alteribacillus sp. HJP-4]|uniref:dipeptidase n=1 Tax=Alteribacillus sp. HJP-4 TaxID=2775394 RepID=UPI0035CD0C97